MAYSGAYKPKEPEEPAASPGTQANTRSKPQGMRNGRRPILDLGELFQKTEVAGMETDDLLLALVLYLMYRESGDTDLLIMLGVILLT